MHASSITSSSFATRSAALVAASFAALVATVVPLAAQVFPRGMDSLPGFGTGSAWDAEKARLVVLIDKAQFPWGAGQPGQFTGFRLRRTGGVLYDMIGGQKTLRVRLSSTRVSAGSSTPVGPTAATASTVMQQNHGAAQPTTMVLAQGQSFPSLGRVPQFYQSFSLPFSHTVRFTQPFQVPADADTLVLDLEIENSNSGSGPYWWPDSASTSGREYTGGFRRIDAQCVGQFVSCCGGGACDDCMDRCRANGFHVGGTLRTELRTGEPNAPAFGWIGYTHPAQLPIPTTPCLYRVDPSTWQFGTTDSFDTSFSCTWGAIPSLPAIIGFRFGVQFAVLSTTLHPAGLAVSSAYEITVGPAPAGAVQFTTIESTCSGNCTPQNDPFTPTATGAVGETPVLEFF